MALPTIYIDTGGHAQGSGSRDSGTPLASGTSGASVSGTTVTLPGGTDLSAVATDGSDTIYIADATNSFQKLFKITAKNDGADTVTVDVAPTGSISNSAWGIGGQLVYSAAVIPGSLRAGWIAQFNNSPASHSGSTMWEVPNNAANDGNSTDGPIKVIGKTGVRPALTVTDTNLIVNGGSRANWWWENLEFVQQGASGNIFVSLGGSCTQYNIKVSDAGGIGVTGVGNGNRLIASEISGVGGDGYDSNARATTMGNYVHDCGGRGIDISSGGSIEHCLFNIVDTCADRGIYVSSDGAAGGAQWIAFCTVYGCGNSGIEVIGPTDYSTIMNNIASENGNAGGEANFEWANANGTEKTAFHGWNLAYHSGGGTNYSGWTQASTEITGDPLFTNPSGGDFSLGDSSPAIAAGFPGQFLGGSLGYLDLGAVQKQQGGGGGGGLTAPILGGYVG